MDLFFGWFSKFEVVFNFLKNNRKYWKYLILIIISVIFSVKCTMYYVDSHRVQSIRDICAEQDVISSMDSFLRDCNYPNKAFLSWIRFERVKDKYIMVWKDIRVLDISGKVNSIKYQSSLYLKSIVVDDNTKSMLDRIPEDIVIGLNKEDAYCGGYCTIYDIYEETITNVDQSKVTLVKRNKDIVWIFSLCTQGKFTKISDAEQRTGILNIANIARTSVLSK